MQELPDYEVINFLEWISLNYPKNKMFLNALLNDRECLLEYAKKYLAGDNEDKYYNFYMQSKRHFRRRLSEVINRELDDYYFKESSENEDKRNEFSQHIAYITEKYQNEFEREISETKRIHQRFHEFYPSCYADTDTDTDAEHLVELLYRYLDDNNMRTKSRTYYADKKEDRNLRILSCMLGCSNQGVARVIDFLDWLLLHNDEEPYDYEISADQLEFFMNRYENALRRKLSKTDRKQILKCFSGNKYDEVLDWIKKVLGLNHEYSMSRVFKRYYDREAKFKCIFLPLKGASRLNEFVDKYWEELNRASDDFLDIIYSKKELECTGTELLEKIHDLKCNVDKLPCLVIWENKISEAQIIKIGQLENDELAQLMLKIIACIRENKGIEQICMEAIETMDKFREQKRLINQNTVNFHGTNNGIVIGVNEGNATNMNSSNATNISDDIERAKYEIRNLKGLDLEQKEDLCEALDDINKAVLSGDQKQVAKCANKMSKVIERTNQNALAVLGGVGSIASIASFLGMTWPL